jgi:UPF0716 protein FxsA
LEISVFILVGGQIGLWATLGFVLLTAILGTILLRWQGLATVNRLRNEFAAGQMPARAMGDGAMLILAGVLLLTPGFVTDAIGFSLFIPAVRSAIFSFFASRVKFTSTASHFGNGTMGGGANSDPYRRPHDFRTGSRSGVVDLDESEFENRSPDPDTPWNKNSGSSDKS